MVGSQIDTEKFTEAVNEAISGFQSTLDMEAEGCYVLPAFTADAPEVAAARDAMNSYLGASITYDFSPYTEVVDSAVISQWVTVDDSMNVTLTRTQCGLISRSLQINMTHTERTGPLSQAAETRWRSPADLTVGRSIRRQSTMP